jgi:hypothetical protein
MNTTRKFLNLSEGSSRLFYVTYGIKGTRMNGSYLVSAPSKGFANKAVKEVNPSDYTRLRSCLVPYPNDLEREDQDNVIDGCFPLDLFDGDDVEKAMTTGEPVFLECGT